MAYDSSTTTAATTTTTNSKEVEIVGFLEVLENRGNSNSNTVSSTFVDSDDASHSHDSIIQNRRRLQASPLFSEEEDNKDDNCSCANDSLHQHLARTKRNASDDSSDGILPIEYESNFVESWFSNSSTCDIKRRLPSSRNVSADLMSMRPKTISNQAA